MHTLRMHTHTTQHTRTHHTAHKQNTHYTHTNTHTTHTDTDTHIEASGGMRYEACQDAAQWILLRSQIQFCDHRLAAHSHLCVFVCVCARERVCVCVCGVYTHATYYMCVCARAFGGLLHLHM